MRRFFCIFLCVFLLLSLVIPAFAGNTIILMYEPWLFYYDLVDSDENHELWLGMYSYGGSEELYPIHIDEDLYNEKLLASERSNVESENSRVVESVSVESSLSDGDSVPSDLHSESDSGYLEAAPFSSGTESSRSQPSVMAVTTVPTSGQSYILPEVVNIEYAPDASPGSLLAVLYGLLGKPVVSYTYKVRTSRDSSSYDGYLVQQLDYDANWLASLFLLVVVLFCIFKAGGALLCRT
jgi:hypothetical protein|nr:MAG TPA: hypothetical protein [Inoviridae sp.]